MIYIRILNGIVEFGGQVANQHMLDDGWTQYEGIIPEGSKFAFVGGQLIATEAAIPPSSVDHVFDTSPITNGVL